MRRIAYIVIAALMLSVGSISAQSRHNSGSHRGGQTTQVHRGDNKVGNKGGHNSAVRPGNNRPGGGNSNAGPGRPGGGHSNGNNSVGRPGGGHPGGGHPGGIGRPNHSYPAPGHSVHPGPRPHAPLPGWRPGRPYHQHWGAPMWGHRVNVRPTIGFSVVFGGLNLWFSNGVYYQPVGAAYEIVRPPIGLIVPELYDPYTYMDAGMTYYVSGGVAYMRVAVPGGFGFQVVRYL